eukprot:scaffold923_cov256-Pinguiococcus_pyrenoidosus.AAC.52
MAAVSLVALGTRSFGVFALVTTEVHPSHCPSSTPQSGSVTAAEFCAVVCSAVLKSGTLAHLHLRAFGEWETCDRSGVSAAVTVKERERQKGREVRREHSNYADEVSAAALVLPRFSLFLRSQNCQTVHSRHHHFATSCAAGTALSAAVRSQRRRDLVADTSTLVPLCGLLYQGRDVLEHVSARRQEERVANHMRRAALHALVKGLRCANDSLISQIRHSNTSLWRVEPVWMLGSANSMCAGCTFSV